MKKFLLFAWGLACSWVSHGQLLDSFSDGDLSSNPAWYGDTGLFGVENGELRLTDPEPESNNVAFLYLAAPVSTNDETVWEWYVRLDFAPSPSNYAQIWLQASQPDLTHPEQTGYFLRIGGVSGTSDALELYRQDGNAQALLISGAPGAMGNQPATARVRVVRSTDGIWSLWTDYSGGSGWQLEGTAQDVTHSQGGFSGLVCRYTASRSDDFYFDDVRIDPLYIDQEGPQLLEAIPLDASSLSVVFDEPLDEASAVDPALYSLSGGMGHPILAEWDPDQPDRVALHFSQAMTSAEMYVLEISGILDQHGNTGGLQTIAFTYWEILPGSAYDVLITEIMADPSPPVALPEVEYVELYNRSADPLQLEGWTLGDGGTPAVFPPLWLSPGAFLLVCDPADTSLLKPYGSVLGLPGFPSLNNGGDRLLLRNASGQFIAQVAYQLDWYGESDKDDGGWSLELINPLAPCAGGPNWRASASLLGGTPGQPNAAWTPQPDVQGPVPLFVFPETDFRGLVVFSEALDSAAAVSAGNFHIEPGLSVLEARWQPDAPREVELAWEPALEAGRLYRLSFEAGLTDCLGNSISEDPSLAFGLPETPAPGDVVINELLFQPEVGGAEFVELYNRSGKIIDLGELILGNIQGSSDSIAPIGTGRLLLPGSYLVVSERPADLVHRYPTTREERMLANDLPVLPDKGGNVTLYVEEPAGTVLVLDAVDYTSEWHHPLLRETRGVSLERIDPAGDGREASNWHSAAASVGYASPTVQNSQFLAFPAPDTAFFLPRKVFSPDGDGLDDFLVVQYQLDEAGYAGSVRIFDAFGRQVASLAENELLAASGHFIWDGVDQHGGKARVGIYIIAAEWVHPGGKRLQIRESCVLAGRL